MATTAYADAHSWHLAPTLHLRDAMRAQVAAGDLCLRKHPYHMFLELERNDDGAYDDDCNEEDVAAFAAECEQVRSLEKNTWIVDDGYYALSGDIDP